MAYAFGEFAFDVEKQQLYRQGEEIHLEPKAMQLLEILIARRPNVVKHQDLYDAIWPDVVVLEANLGNLVSDLRNALDDRDRKLIRTAHGRGYSFRGEVLETDADSPSRQIVLRYGRRRFDLEPGENIIGRGPDTGVRINDTEISRRHARIVLEPDRATIEDLGSKNGTIVNGTTIEGRIPIDDGDEILLGTITLTVTVVLATGSTKTALRR